MDMPAATRRSLGRSARIPDHGLAGFVVGLWPSALMSDCCTQLWSCEERRTPGFRSVDRWPPASESWVKMPLHSVYDEGDPASAQPPNRRKKEHASAAYATRRDLIRTNARRCRCYGYVLALSV